ncbi:lamin tail domain-containing protein [Flavihumibacter sp. RY-1]|uniref:Lamin tail domain-containing protein n=1 Tax=Flavihumibacter fluminis TaxID=2909236 RepID=A0ABS9BKS6_9BACT|nr:lamin tail domain-containing protein [Flavihumibacter fluminis]MCF1715785.1 lamin tail domain-containing protein [Flavihumibacter fluminis]
MWKWMQFAVLVFSFETLYGQGFPVVITEIMGDPLPSVGLPAEEFVELTNVSTLEISLSGWKLSNGRTIGRLGDSVRMAPGEILILCPARAINLFTSYGRTIGLSPFPAISNAGDTLFLLNEKDELVFAAAYLPSLLKDEKADGGWSLEMVNKEKTCRQINNWRASLDTSGGSPGKTNSHSPSIVTLPVVDPIHAWCPDEYTIRIAFTDRIHQLVAEQAALYKLEAGPEVEKVELLAPFQQEMLLHLRNALEPGKIYTLQVAAIPGCDEDPEQGAGFRKLKVGLADTTEKAIVINEILADPINGGSDFIELFHFGKAPVQLEGWQIASRNSNGNLSGLRALVPGPRFLYPGDFLVVTTDANWIQRQYLVKHPNCLVELASLPSFPNDKGTVVLLDAMQQVIDEVQYDAAWHHEMLRNTENVSLERRDPAVSSLSALNWTSAAAHAGYGTPGYENSQAGIPDDPDRVFLTEQVVSPDGDGHQDYCEIQYEFAQPGYQVSIRIFDHLGNPHRMFINNGICAMKGSFKWDGRNDKHHLVANGLYIIVVDAWHLSGKTKRYRLAVTLGKKY